MTFGHSHATVPGRSYDVGRYGTAGPISLSSSDLAETLKLQGNRASSGGVKTKKLLRAKEEALFYWLQGHAMPYDNW